MGVDELDRIKTDGKRILLVGEKELRYFDVESSAGTPRDTLLLDSYTQGHQIFMSGDRVMVVSRGTLAAAELWEGGLWEGNDQAPLTRIELVDISDPEHLQSVRTIFVDGDYVSARLIEDQVRLVLRTHPFSTFEFATADDFYDYGQLDWPGKELGFPKVNDWTEANEVASKYNEYLIQNSSAEDWLPQYNPPGRRRYEQRLALRLSGHRASGHRFGPRSPLSGHPRYGSRRLERPPRWHRYLQHRRDRLRLPREHLRCDPAFQCPRGPKPGLLRPQVPGRGGRPRHLPCDRTGGGAPAQSVVDVRI